MLIDQFQLFDAVIDLTNKRDRCSLIKELTLTLSRLLKIDTIIFLQVPANGDGEYLEIVSSIPAAASQDIYSILPSELGPSKPHIDSNMARCLNTKTTTTVSENNATRTLIPIKDIRNNKVTAILDLYGYNETASSKQVIDGFIRLFSNFVAIIDDNSRDTLTGLLNRKTFNAQLSTLLSHHKPSSQDNSVSDERRSTKPGVNHWLGILDIDHFKSINDNFGHVYGDEVLLLFANLMKKTFRSSDLLFRYGGEEFVVVLTSTQDSSASMVFERFRQQLEQFNFPQIGQVTVSTGMVKVSSSDQPTSVLDRADKALYYVKQNGRNRVGDFQQLLDDGLIKMHDINTDIELF